MEIADIILPGFNRNIVECKAGHQFGEWKTLKVLIETLWNVKEFVKSVWALFHMQF